MAYAVAADLAAPPWNLTPADPDSLLERASDDIDRVLIGAIYDVDTNELPTDPVVAEALKRATCAQALFRSVLADPSGGLGQLRSFTIGSISGTRATGPNGQPAASSRYSDTAVDILRVAGLVPVAPRSR